MFRGCRVGDGREWEVRGERVCIKSLMGVETTGLKGERCAKTPRLKPILLTQPNFLLEHHFCTFRSIPSLTGSTLWVTERRGIHPTSKGGTMLSDDFNY